MTVPREALENSEVTVVGVVRNAARGLAGEVARLGRAFGDARTLGFVVVESDSTDGTPAVLTELSRTVPRFRGISLGRLADRIPLRTERIAHCRNRYLDEIAPRAGETADGYVVVADLDGVNAALEPGAVRTCFASAVPWDVCTANQRDFYYDIWALRHAAWSPDDCWVRYRALQPILGSRQALEAAVHSRMVHLAPGGPMIEVASAFGGLAIYRRAALRGARYATRAPDGSAACEHVALHRDLGERGLRIFINPALVNARSTEHSWNRKWLARTVRRVAPGLHDPDPQALRSAAALPRLLRNLKSIAARLS